MVAYDFVCVLMHIYQRWRSHEIYTLLNLYDPGR